MSKTHYNYHQPHLTVEEVGVQQIPGDHRARWKGVRDGSESSPSTQKGSAQQQVSGEIRSAPGLACLGMNPEDWPPGPCKVSPECLGSEGLRAALRDAED